MAVNVTPNSTAMVTAGMSTERAPSLDENEEEEVSRAIKRLVTFMGEGLARMNTGRMSGFDVAEDIAPAHRAEALGMQLKAFVNTPIWKAARGFPGRRRAASR